MTGRPKRPKLTEFEEQALDELGKIASCVQDGLGVALYDSAPRFLECIAMQCEANGQAQSHMVELLEKLQEDTGDYLALKSALERIAEALELLCDEAPRLVVALEKKAAE